MSPKSHCTQASKAIPLRKSVPRLPLIPLMDTITFTKPTPTTYTIKFFLKGPIQLVIILPLAHPTTTLSHTSYSLAYAPLPHAYAHRAHNCKVFSLKASKPMISFTYNPPQYQTPLHQIHLLPQLFPIISHTMQN